MTQPERRTTSPLAASSSGGACFGRSEAVVPPEMREMASAHGQRIRGTLQRERIQRRERQMPAPRRFGVETGRRVQIRMPAAKAAAGRRRGSRARFTHEKWTQSPISLELRQIQSFKQGSFFLLNLLLQKHQRVNQLFRPGWAPRDIDVYRNNLIHGNNCVIIEDAG